MTREASPAALALAADVLAEGIGLRVEGSMRGRVARAVREGARERGEAPDAFARRLVREPAARQRLVDRITVRETRFFRDAGHFAVLGDLLADGVEPGLLWSAGCANGQEPWSLAMALAEASAGEWGVLATDVSAPALSRTRAGAYDERELAGLDPGRRERFMRRREDGGAWEVVPALRGRVRVVAHNLLDPALPVVEGSCRVVFCRNVLIYLDPAATARALANLRRAMTDDGWLFVGASEVVNARARDFVAERHGSVYVYRPRPAGRRQAERLPVSRPREPRAVAVAAPAPPPAPAPLPTPGELLADGERLAAAGRFGEAAGAFRRAAYLAPEDWSAYVRLALALERSTEPASARRAFRAARRALAADAGGDADHDGWGRAEVVRLLDDKLGPA